MRLTATIMAISTMALTSMAHASSCSVPVTDTYMGKGTITAVSTKIVTDRFFGRVKKFTFKVNFYGHAASSHWTLRAVNTPSNVMVVGDTFVWQYSQELSDHYHTNHYLPVVVHRKSDGSCERTSTDFSSPKEDIVL